jgi:branched-chain amino acid transport system permease protein
MASPDATRVHHADFVTDVAFLAFLVVDGALAGAVYALVGLTFVVAYKASRIANFAVGDFITLAARMVGASFDWLGLGLGGALGVACAGMVAVSVGVNRVIFRPLVGQPVMSLIMATIGLGALMQGSSALALGGVSGRMATDADPLVVGSVPVSRDKLLAALVASACAFAVSWFFRATRTGLALRAIASDPQVAIGVGIDIQRHMAITWALAGILSVLAGTLWTLASGGGFGLQLLGLKVFPIVMLGGLDSIPGAIIGALLVGVLESVAAGFIDPVVGSAFSRVVAYLVLLAMLFVRPYGLLGRRAIDRV